MLTDNEKMKDVRKSKNRPILAETPLHWSDKQKMEAVTTYLMLGGNLNLTSATLRIPYHTLYTWKSTEWWNKLVGEVRKEERLTLSTKLKKLMEKSWDAVEDRITNGDYIYDQKAQQMVRKPVALRDVAKVANDTALLREKMEMTENFTVAADQIEDKLSKLAKAFSDLSKGVSTGPVEDIPYVEQGEEPNALDA